MNSEKEAKIINILNKAEQIRNNNKSRRTKRKQKYHYVQ